MPIMHFNNAYNAFLKSENLMNNYAVTIRTTVERIRYVVKAHSSGDAIDAALSQFGAENAVGISIHQQSSTCSPVQ